MALEQNRDELPVPSHVPRGLIYDYDFVSDTRLIADPYERMKSLHREVNRRLRLRCKPA